jgi:hypothetical protein
VSSANALQAMSSGSPPSAIFLGRIAQRVEA